jgi:hypothetical protein
MTGKELIEALAGCRDLEKRVVIVTSNGYQPIDSVAQSWNDYENQIALDTNDPLFEQSDIDEAEADGKAQGIAEERGV